MTFSVLKLILSSKYRMINNHMDAMKGHLWIHVTVGFLVLIILMGGGTGFFFGLFDFLLSDNIRDFGEALLTHLLGMIFLAFFSMLVFSNIIITLSTTYISRELDFYMSSPIHHRHVFLVKLIESIIYSSWAFAILAMPIFMAYGAAEEVPWRYYPLTIILVVPFMLIPGAIGAIVTMLISAYLPARKTRILSVVLAAGTILASVISVRVLGFRRIFSLSETQDINQIMNFLQLGNEPIFPNYWLTRGVVAAGAGDLREWFYWFCMLAATALMLYQVCWWMVPRLYYRGWCLSKESASQTEAGKKFSLLNYVDRVLKFLPRQTRALVSKDVKTFWRDPAQWSQIIILFGLLFIYIGNLRSAARYSGTINIFLSKWQTILSFFNLGATCFILSIITTRFTYPMLSLEGKQFWAVGLAPMDRRRVVWEKFWLSAITAMILAELMMIFSNYILKVDAQIRALSMITIFVMSFALTGMSVGLGAISPNFKEDNPARIANGFGGTINVVLSLLYTGVVISFELFPIYLDAVGTRRLAAWPMKYAVPYVFIFFMVNAAVLIVPMKLGLEKWRAMEM